MLTCTTIPVRTSTDARQRTLRPDLPEEKRSAEDKWSFSGGYLPASVYLPPNRQPKGER
jgi:hypothetical protein